MNRSFIVIYVLGFMILLMGCADLVETKPSLSPEKSFYSRGSEGVNYIEISKVTDTVWLHTTYEKYNGVRFSSNGLIILTSEGLVLIDTPWNNEQAKELINLSTDIFQKDFVMAFITHAHMDRIGGIDILIENDVEVISTSLTAQIAEMNGYKKPKANLDHDPIIQVGEKNIEVYYPGEGHSKDNIVIWLAEDKILFGGCLVKSLNSNGLGSTVDANIEAWPASISNVMIKYSDAEHVIPGHGKWGDKELLQHTLELLNK